MILFPRAPRPLPSISDALVHVAAPVVSAFCPTAAGRVETNIDLPFLYHISSLSRTSAYSMDSPSSLTIEQKQKPRIVGLGCPQADEQNLANIRELRDHILQIRTHFQSIGTSLQTFDKKGYMPYTYFLGQVIRGRPLALEPQWNAMSNVCRPPLSSVICLLTMLRRSIPYSRPVSVMQLPLLSCFVVCPSSRYSMQGFTVTEQSIGQLFSNGLESPLLNP
jgi:hypothetical protein